jgi:hypothetical protein
MNKEFFLEQMKVITADFGDVEYTPHRLGLIWQAVHDLPEQNFRNIVLHFCRTRSVKYPPLPTHFHEEAVNQRKLLAPDRIFATHRRDSDRLEHTEGSLQRVLQRLGVSSISEALNKNRQQNRGDSDLDF